MPLLSISDILSIEGRANDNDTAPCFYYNGTVSGDVPCDIHAPFKACCPPSWNCATSLHCGPEDLAFPPTCSDAGWKDDACPFAQGLSMTHALKILDSLEIQITVP